MSVGLPIFLLPPFCHLYLRLSFLHFACFSPCFLDSLLLFLSASLCVCLNLKISPDPCLFVVSYNSSIVTDSFASLCLLLSLTLSRFVCLSLSVSSALFLSLSLPIFSCPVFFICCLPLSLSLSVPVSASLLPAYISPFFFFMFVCFSFLNASCFCFSLSACSDSVPV